MLFCRPVSDNAEDVALAIDNYVNSPSNIQPAVASLHGLGEADEAWEGPSMVFPGIIGHISERIKMCNAVTCFGCVTWTAKASTEPREFLSAIPFGRVCPVVRHLAVRESMVES